MSKNQKIVFELSLPEDVPEKISQAIGKPPAEALIIAAGTLLTQYANGGKMLDGRLANRIGVALKNPNASGDEIVRAVESGVGMDEDAMIVRYRLSPDKVAALKELAAIQDRTVSQFVQDGFDYCMHMGWLFEIPFLGLLLSFDEDLVVRLRAAAGEQEITAPMVVEAFELLRQVYDKQKQEAEGKEAGEAVAA